MNAVASTAEDSSTAVVLHLPDAVTVNILSHVVVNPPNHEMIFIAAS